MDDTRIQILIDKHRQHLTKKVEESFGHAGKEWAAQGAELHILCADVENRRKEGRSQYPNPPRVLNRGLAYLGEIPHRGNQTIVGRLQRRSDDVPTRSRGI